MKNLTKQQIMKMEHNVKAVKQINKCIKNSQTFVCSNATGSGKSLIIQYVVRKRCFKNPCIIVNDTRTSVAKWAIENNISLITYRSLSKYDMSAFDAIVCDEAHHILSKKCKDICVKLEKEKKLYLFTATTQRTDRQDLIDFVDEEICTLTFTDAILEGIYAKPKYIYSYLRECDVDITKYNTRAKLNGRSAEETLEKYVNNQHKIIIFETSNKQLEKDYNILNPALSKLGFTSRMFTSKHYEKDSIEWFNNNDKTVLFTCNLLNESHHLDDVDCEIILRHTSSMIIVNQQIGRLASFDNENKLVVLDLACNKTLIEKFALGEKLDELSEAFRLDKNGEARKANIRNILDVEFDMEQIDPWNIRRIIKYQNKEYTVQEFSKEFNVKYRAVYNFIRNRQFYNDDNVNKLIKTNFTRVKQYCIYYNGKQYSLSSFSKLLNISMNTVKIRLKELNKKYLTDEDIKFIKEERKRVKSKLNNPNFTKYCKYHNLERTEENYKKYLNERKKSASKDSLDTLESLGITRKSWYTACKRFGYKTIEEFLKNEIYGFKSESFIIDGNYFKNKNEAFTTYNISPIIFYKWRSKHHYNNDCYAVGKYVKEHRRNK